MGCMRCGYQICQCNVQYYPFPGPQGPRGFPGPTGPGVPFQGVGTGSIVLFNDNLYYNNPSLLVLNNYIQVGLSILPSPTNVYDLGSIDNRFNQLYINQTMFISNTGTISTNQYGNIILNSYNTEIETLTTSGEISIFLNKTLISNYGNYTLSNTDISNLFQKTIVIDNFVQNSPFNLNKGLNLAVFNIYVFNSTLYAVGAFTNLSDGSTPGLNYIAKYDLNTDTWSPLNNNGLNLFAFAVVSWNNYIVVGGQFTNVNTGSIPGLNYIAKYDTNTDTWSALSNNGLNSFVNALYVDNDILYVGGEFTNVNTGSIPGLNYIAKYDLNTDTWIAFNNNGLNNATNALYIDNNILYVGGRFTDVNSGSVPGLNRIAKYDLNTDTWSALNNSGLDSNVLTLYVDNNMLYVGGQFTNVGTTSIVGLNNIAKYDLNTDTWMALSNNGLNNTVRSLTVKDGILYVGGLFTNVNTGSIDGLNYIAKYNVNANFWISLPKNGLNNFVRTLFVSGNDLYVGGDFTNVNLGTVDDLFRIAKYDINDLQNIIISGDFIDNGSNISIFIPLFQSVYFFTYLSTVQRWIIK